MDPGPQRKKQRLRPQGCLDLVATEAQMPDNHPHRMGNPGNRKGRHEASQSIVEGCMPSADGTTVISSPAHGARRWPDAGASRIPNWVYSDPDLYALEQERIFEGPNWSYVCLEAEIRKSRRLQAHVHRRQIGGRHPREGRRRHRRRKPLRTSRVAILHASSGTDEDRVPLSPMDLRSRRQLLAVPFRHGVKRQGGMPADFRRSWAAAPVRRAAARRRLRLRSRPRSRISRIISSPPSSALRPRVRRAGAR